VKENLSNSEQRKQLSSNQASKQARKEGRKQASKQAIKKTSQPTITAPADYTRTHHRHMWKNKIKKLAKISLARPLPTATAHLSP